MTLNNETTEHKTHLFGSQIGNSEIVIAWKTVLFSTIQIVLIVACDSFVFAVAIPVRFFHKM